MITLRAPVIFAAIQAAPVLGAKLKSVDSTAARDPDGANLDRAQIVKGWLDAQGKLQEKVYGLAWSGDRVIDLS